MSLQNIVAKPGETKGFVKLETTFGELAFPAAADAVYPLGVPTYTQEDEFAESREAAESRDMGARKRVGTAAGSMTLQIYARPSGVAGTAPVEDALMEAALGKKTVNAGVSVVYEPAIVKKSFSFCYREGHITHFLVGCKVGTFKPNLTKKDLITLEFGIQFQKAMRAGTAETVTGSTTSVINLDEDQAKRIDVGTYVQVGDDDNTGAGYLVSARDLDADTITLDSEVSSAPAAEVVVKGFLPTPPAADSDDLITGMEGVLTLDGQETAMTGFSLEVNDNLGPDDEETNTGGFIVDLNEGNRAVTGTINARFRLSYADWWHRAREQTEGAIIATTGGAAGKKVKYELPKGLFNTPGTDGDEYRRNVTVSLIGIKTSGEDSIKVTYE